MRHNSLIAAGGRHIITVSASIRTIGALLLFPPLIAFSAAPDGLELAMFAPETGEGRLRQTKEAETLNPSYSLSVASATGVT